MHHHKLEVGVVEEAVVEVVDEVVAVEEEDHLVVSHLCKPLHLPIMAKDW